MLSVLLTSLVSFAITFLVIPIIIRVANEKKLYDVPDARKVHSRHIASLGGVGIFLGFVLSVLLSANITSPNFQYFIAGAIIMFFLGLKDDILVLSAKKKFLVQMAAAAVVIHFGGIRIDSMHGLMNINALPEPIGIALSYITIIMVINAFNLIDGVDGLAASLGMLTMTIFGTYFLMSGHTEFAVMAFAMAGGLMAFLYFNYHPAKIFMGDSGSLLLGLLNAIMVIKFITVADDVASPIPVASSVAIGIAILIVPLLDTIRVFSIRLAKGRSPFSPDRNHIHHLLLDRGLNHRGVTITCLLINIFFIAGAYMARSWGSTFLVFLMLIISFSAIGALIFFRKPARKLVIAGSFNHKEQVLPSTKVVSLKNEAAAVEQ
jgi:UDP-N-acetylmuramyl pentapeptide phosphotransferase/UDP-N-acetylglucosamine-1-phosphate transferase